MNIQRLFLFGLGLGAFVGLVAFLFSGAPPADENDDTKSGTDQQVVLEEPKAVRDITPEQLSQVPDVETEPLQRLPALEPPPQPKKPPKPVSFSRPVILSAGRFESGDMQVALAGVMATEPDHECTTASGETWPCGRFAKNAFRNFVRNRTIECNPAEPSNGTITTRCRIGKQDLSQWLVKTGWAEAEEGLFSQDHEAARTARIGLWRDERP